MRIKYKQSWEPESAALTNSVRDEVARCGFVEEQIERNAAILARLLEHLYAKGLLDNETLGKVLDVEGEIISTEIQ